MIWWIGKMAEKFCRTWHKTRMEWQGYKANGERVLGGIHVGQRHGDTARCGKIPRLTLNDLPLTFLQGGYSHFQKVVGLYSFKEDYNLLHTPPPLLHLDMFCSYLSECSWIYFWKVGVSARHILLVAPCQWTRPGVCEIRNFKIFDVNLNDGVL